MRGGQWQVLYLMEGLAPLGYEQHLLAPTGSPLMAAAAARGLSASAISISAVARHARQADIVHAHTARAHALAAPFADTRLVIARRVAFPLRRRARHCSTDRPASLTLLPVSEPNATGERVPVTPDSRGRHGNRQA